MRCTKLDQEFKLLKRVIYLPGFDGRHHPPSGWLVACPISTLVDIYMTKGAEVFKPYTPFSPVPPPALIDMYPQAAALRAICCT